MAEVYTNPLLFKEALSNRFEDFDYDASSKLPRFFFADKQGEIYQSVAATHMFDKLNKRFGEFIDPLRCVARRRVIVITYLEDGESLPKEVIKESTEVVVNEEIKVQEPIFVQFAESNEKNNEESTDLVEQPSPEEIFNKNYANTLYNSKSKAKSKDALEEYGLKFGIDLKKNMSFANMLSALEDHVNSSN